MEFRVHGLRMINRRRRHILLSSDVLQLETNQESKQGLLILVVRPEMIIGIMDAIPFGSGTSIPGEPANLRLRRRGTTSGSTSSLSIDFTNTPRVRSTAVWTQSTRYIEASSAVTSQKVPKELR